MKTVIGLVGVKASGKTTTTSILKDLISKKTQDTVKEVALADKLKDVCSSAFNIPRNTFDCQKYKEIPFSIFNLKTTLEKHHIEYICKEFSREEEYRKADFSKIIGTQLTSARNIAQIVGTEVLRSLGDEDIHCKSISMDADINIISDIRFPNEYEYFKKLEEQESIRFHPLYVYRKKAENEIDLENSHGSETSVFLIKDRCLQIDNNGTLEDLRKNIEYIVKEM
jgi:dephospho-CoA kinase